MTRTRTHTGIHNNLKIFVTDPPYDQTQAELRKFLVTLIGQDKIECSADTYTIKK
jgi:hypothetical protein